MQPSLAHCLYSILFFLFYSVFILPLRQLDCRQREVRVEKQAKKLHRCRKAYVPSFPLGNKHCCEGRVSRFYFFSSNFVFTVFCEVSDRAVQFSPRPDPQRYRFWCAAAPVLRCMTAPPTGRKQSYHAAACNEFWVIAYICSCHMVR